MVRGDFSGAIPRQAGIHASARLGIYWETRGYFIGGSERVRPGCTCSASLNIPQLSFMLIYGPSAEMYVRTCVYVYAKRANRDYALFTPNPAGGS